MIETVLDLVHEKSVLRVAPYYDGVHSSIVYTYHGNYKLVETVNEIMNEICICFCSDLQGRMNGTRKKFNYTKKPPIVISELLGQVAMPLPSHIRGEDQWFFIIDFNVDVIGPSKCKITFDHLCFEIPLSRESIEQQRLRTINVLYSNTYSNNYKIQRKPEMQLI